MGIRGDLPTRSFIRESAAKADPMVYTSYVYDAPLLPFEVQICNSIGATEEEYRLLVTEALRRSAVRPAEYKHIPDIRAELSAFYVAGKGLTALGMIVLGIALTTAGYLLQPKPKQPKYQSRTLDSINQAGRFTPTFGFDSIAELGNYNDPIPIFFGKAVYENNIYQEGGLLMTPTLVWSRMFSWGTQQSIKQLWVVGEQGVSDDIAPEGINLPNLEGIYLGNTPLDAIFEDYFAFYWKKHNADVPGEGATYRVRASNFQYGTRGTPSSGDPETNDDIFLCPVIDSGAEEAFCSTHNLSSNAEFGVFAPIPNGTCFRPDWKVVNWLRRDPGTDDPGMVNEFTSRKIVGSGQGTKDRYHGMPGTGRNYSRRMGITKVTDASGNPKHAQPNNTTEVIKIVNVVKGDVAEFVIRRGTEKLADDWLNNGRVKVGDITGAVHSFRERADDALQLGEVFQIGRTYWKVTKRAINTWRADDEQDQIIELTCIDDDPSPGSTNEIGINSDRVLRPLNAIGDLDSHFADWDPVAEGSKWETRDYVTDTLGYDGLGGAGIDAIAPGPDHFPLLKVSKAIFKTTRACDVIEIGLKSRVYTELTGLCNFQSVPSPSDLGGWWRREIATTSGTTNSYIKRASTFVIMVRETGVNSDGSKKEWEQIGLAFAVVGKQPIDLYNWIRIKHPQKGNYEYEFKPMTGATLHRQSVNKPYIVLEAGIGDVAHISTITRTVPTVNYGTFIVETRGVERERFKLQKNKEFVANPRFNDGFFNWTTPSEVLGAGHFTPEISSDAYIQRIFMMRWIETVAINGRAGGISSAFNHEIFGTPDRAPGQRKHVWVREVLADGRMINIEWIGEVKACPGHWAGVDRSWDMIPWDEDRQLGGFNFRHPGSEFGENEEFTITKTISNSNPFRVASSPASGPNLSTASKKYRVVTRSGTLERANHGKAHAVRWEVFGSADNHPVGYQHPGVTKNIEKTLVDSTTIKISLNLTSTVINQPAQDPINGWPGITKSWGPVRVSVVQGNNTTEGWNVFTTDENGNNNAETSVVEFEETTGNTNPFFLPNQKIRMRFHITALTQVATEVAVYDGDRFFESSSQYADISYYGDTVRRSNDSAPEHVITYVNEIISNEERVPQYNDLVLAGLSLKAARQFDQIDQVRFWAKEGLHVRRLHPDLEAVYGDDKPVGASHLFTDLVYHLLTDTVSGAGRLLGITHATSDNLVDVNDFIETSKFLVINKLWCNGAVSDGTSIRSFVSDNAPTFLCDATIKDGRFSLKPALPITAEGNIAYNEAVTIKQLFTAGNILEGSFNVNYLSTEERREARAVVRYRKESEFSLPKEETVVISKGGRDDMVTETFDLTGFCTTRSHAILVGKYFLSLRDNVTHSISFSTTPYGLDLAPGDLIKVSTETTPFSSAATGSISNSGILTSASTIADGTYEILYYKTGLEEDVTTGTMTVSDGIVSESTFHSSIFTLQVTTDSQEVYRVESIALTEDTIVEITASEFPCDDGLVSKIARDLHGDLGPYTTR